MKYYKIILDNNFIGVVSSENFRKYNKDSGFLLRSNELEGEYVRYEDLLYRDFWMSEISTTLFTYTNAQITEITSEEYQTIISLEDNTEEIIRLITPEEETVSEETEEVEITPDITIEYIKTMKLKQLSAQCRLIIENGFDLELRGKNHHFSLDTQDQLNLISLSAMAQTQSMIPYHADGEMCIFYTAEEINQIVETATAFKVYHTTYYNALKGYINALDTAEAISAIEYGTPIPEEYKSDVLRMLEA